MSPTNQQAGFGIEIPFLLLASATWFAGLALFPVSQTNVADHLAGTAPFVAFAIASSFFLLRSIGYFDVVRLFPRRSDLLAVIIALPLGGIASWFINSSLLQLDDPLLLSATTVSPLFGLFFFGLHHIATSFIINQRGAQKIVLDLSPQERTLVLQDLAGWGFLDRITILSREELETELLGPNPRSVALLVISQSTAQCFEHDETILEAHLAGIPIVDYRNICARLSGRVRLAHSNVWDYVLAATPQTMLIRLYSLFKNVFEPVLASFLALILAPIFLLIAIGIKLSSPGPVFFQQSRVGYKGRTFPLIKFRTMHCNSSEVEASWCQENDVRITKFGKFLRKSRLDELPQLWNVVRGEMSFIGPRPEQPALEKKLREKIPAFALRTLVKPGISGWAQVCAGYAASVEESRSKLEYDLFYIQNMSPRLDLIVVFRTIYTAFVGEKKMPRLVVVENPNSFVAQAPLAKESYLRLVGQ